MKFALVASFAALAVSSVIATPTVAEGSNLEARTFCTSGQFWYQARSCCLDKGGPKSTPPTPAGKDCPNNWYWHGTQSCCVPREKPPTTTPPEPECVPRGGKKWKWSRGGQCCEPGDNTPEPPKPSQNPFGNNYGFNYGYHNHKREEAPVAKRHAAKAIAGRRVMTCPADYVACPIDGAVTSGDWECVSPTEDITSCGGCSSTGEGQDCTAIAHSWNVSCDIGSCKVLSCMGGFKVAADGKSCVAL